MDLRVAGNRRPSAATAACRWRSAPPGRSPRGCEGIGGPGPGRSGFSDPAPPPASLRGTAPARAAIEPVASRKADRRLGRGPVQRPEPSEPRPPPRLDPPAPRPPNNRPAVRLPLRGPTPRRSEFEAPPASERRPDRSGLGYLRVSRALWTKALYRLR